MSPVITNQPKLASLRAGCIVSSLLLFLSLDILPASAQSPKLALLYLLSQGNNDDAQVAASSNHVNPENSQTGGSIDDALACELAIEDALVCEQITGITAAMKSTSPDTHKVSDELCATPETLHYGATVQGSHPRRNAQDSDGGLQRLPWNDGLPWNCGAASASLAPANTTGGQPK